MKRLLALLVVVMGYAGQASACESFNGIPDFNCDGKLSVSVLGDSLVFGTGDVRKGGYVSRAAATLTNVEFHNFGEAGLKAAELVKRIDRLFRGSGTSTLKTALANSDIVVLDLGRNDRWFFQLPSATYRQLKRIAARIKSGVESGTGTAPLVVTAVMMLPNRGSQGPWVAELNKLILKGSTADNPSDLRFDLVSKRLLSTDQIHPTSSGYKQLATTFVKYLTRTLPPRMRKQRSDEDADGIFDRFELSKFGTDPTLLDTDGDTISDGEEVFVLETDPLTVN